MYMNFNIILTIAILYFSGNILEAKIYKNDNLFCDDNKNCQISLANLPLAVNICEEMEPKLYWKKEGHGNFLLACECNCTSHDNMGWFIFSSQDKVQGISLGKYVTPEFLHKADRISDIITSHPLCNKINNNEIDKADFITLIKYPTTNDNDPYCFEVRSIHNDSGELLITENNFLFEKDDVEIFFNTDVERSSMLFDLIRQITLFSGGITY